MEMLQTKEGLRCTTRAAGAQYAAQMATKIGTKVLPTLFVSNWASAMAPSLLEAIMGGVRLRSSLPIFSADLRTQASPPVDITAWMAPPIARLSAPMPLV